MELLASCSLERSKTFNGKLILPSEEKKSPDKVVLNVVVFDEDCSDVFTKLPDNIKCVTFMGSKKATYCPSELHGNVFNQYDLDDALNNRINPVPGVVDLVQLPEGYCDMRTLVGICRQYPTVRVIGGNLLRVDGVRIGRYDKGKEKMPFVLCDMYDTFVEVDLDDLSGIEEKVKKVCAKAVKLESGEKKQKKSKGGSKKSAEKKAPKRVEAFNSMFGGYEEEF